MSSVYDLFQPSMQEKLRAATARKRLESQTGNSTSSTLAGSEEPGDSTGNNEALPVLTADGRSFALVGSNLNDIDVHAMKDFKEAQEEEIRNCESSLRIASLEAFQRCGHVSDVAKQIVRCPLCPFYKVTVESAGMKKQWRRCLLRHIRSRHQQNTKKTVPKKKGSKKRAVLWKQGGKWRGAQFIASGSKQLRVAKTLFNFDRLIRKKGHRIWPTVLRCCGRISPITQA